VRHGNILYFAHPVFRHYRIYGAVANREFIARSIRSFLGESISLSTNLPSTARLALTSQPEEKRHVLHVLYAPAIHRGGNIQLLGGKGVEVIEDLPSLHGTEITLRPPSSVSAARLVPQDVPLTIETTGDRITLRLPEFSCHQIVELGSR
jgi:hypothetical protein